MGTFAESIGKRSGKIFANLPVSCQIQSSDPCITVKGRIVTEFPNTQSSLLIRIADPADRDAWAEFVAIYRPLIYRIARRRGCQDADAQDLTQSVLVSVTKAIGEWESNPNRARFRTWLTRVIRNQVVDEFRKQSSNTATGGSAVVELLHQQPDSINEIEIADEYRRAIFRQAANSIRNEFVDATWTAFWLTAVEGESIATAARKTSLSIGSVYAARSRITKRLKLKIDELEKSHE